MKEKLPESEFWSISFLSPDIKALAKLSNGETKLIVTTSNPRSNKLEFQIPNENWRSAEQLLREHHIAWEPAVDVGPG